MLSNGQELSSKIFWGINEIATGIIMMTTQYHRTTFDTTIAKERNNKMIKSYCCFILLLMYFFGCDSSNPVLQELDSGLPNIHWFVELDGQFVEADSVFIDTTDHSAIKLKVEVGFDDPAKFHKFTLGPDAYELNFRHIGLGGFSWRGLCLFYDSIIYTPAEKLSCDGFTLSPEPGWTVCILEFEIYDAYDMTNDQKRFALIKLISSGPS